uniref:Ig-like domain-containing protein n=1 Tax=Pygocentrus nattereri TaxID=42514 RepID=A0A3B4CZU3_PYGNA
MSRLLVHPAFQPKTAVIDPNPPPLGKVGGAVQLTCRYDHLLPVKGVYFQKKNLSGLYELLVNGFYTNSVKDYLHDEYKHRTRVNRTERSLDFWNLKASDEGHYKSVKQIQYILLQSYISTCKNCHFLICQSLMPFPFPQAADYSIPTVTVQECSDHGEGALSCELCCSSFGGYPLANLSWTVLEDSNDVLLQEVGSVSTADKHSGVWNVSQIVRFNCTQPTTVSCSVGGAVLCSIHQPCHQGPLCVEFACSPRVCVAFLPVLQFPPAVQRHAVRPIGHAKLPLGVRDSHPVQGVSWLPPDDRWDRLQHPPSYETIAFCSILLSIF